jgi:hypothetical protein
MSKKKRTKKVAVLPTIQLIHSSLRADFHCTEEEIELIDQALAGRCPIEIANYINDIGNGKVPLRIRPTICLDMEDGTFQNIRLTNHPITLLYDYLDERYDKVFSTLYWSALTPPYDTKGFLGFLRMLKKVPHLQKDLVETGRIEVEK